MDNDTMHEHELDLTRARRETPGCERVLHFNNAGASLMPQPVLAAVSEHLQLEASIGGYEAAEAAHSRIDRFYDAAARLVGARREEIAFIENATRAWDMAFYAIPFEPGDRILTSQAEYASNYIAFLQVARRTGATIEVIPDDEYGQTSTQALRRMLDRPARLIAITHMPTNGGLINPAEEIGAIAREAGVLFLLDACQTIGQLPIDVRRIGCHMLSATGRKYLRGPRGTGFLYVEQSLAQTLEPPLLDMHAAEWVAPDSYAIRPDARRFENWEAFYAGKVGLATAIDYAWEWGLDAIAARVHHLAALLRARLRAMPGVSVHDLGRTQGGIVSFTVQGHTAQEVRRALAAGAINISVSGLQSTRLDMQRRELQELARASVHYYNSEEEIERFCRALSAIVTG